MNMGMKSALLCCDFVARIARFGVSLLVLVCKVESVLSQKPKQANALCYSLWIFVARFGFSWLFVGTKNQNEQQKAKKSPD